MSEGSITDLINIVVPTTSAGLLLLLLPPYVLPTAITGIRSEECPRPTSISLIITSILYSVNMALTPLLGRPNWRDGTDLCAINALLEVFVTTAVVAHLPIVATVMLALKSTPSHQELKHLSATKWSLLLATPYLFAVLPTIPILVMKFNLQWISAIWWGFYCIEKDGWWRIVRSLSLTLPLVITLVLSVMVYDLLWSCTDHHAPHVRVKRMEVAAVTYLVICCLAVIAYVIAEQIVGWLPNWEPRISEVAAGPLVWLAFAVDGRMWRSYAYWLRGRRPPLTELSTLDAYYKEAAGPSFNPYPPSSNSSNFFKQNLSRSRSVISSQSSFYIPPPTGPIQKWRSFRRKSSNKRPAKDSKPALSLDDRPIPRSQANPPRRNISIRRGDQTPPFVYSIAHSDASLELPVPAFPEYQVDRSTTPVELKRWTTPPSPSYYIPRPTKAVLQGNSALQVPTRRSLGDVSDTSGLAYLNMHNTPARSVPTSPSEVSQPSRYSTSTLTVPSKGRILANLEEIRKQEQLSDPQRGA